MRLTAIIGENERQLDVTRSGEGFAVSIDGELHQVEATRMDGATWLLLIDGKSYEVDVEGEDEEELGVRVRGQIHRLRVMDERRLRMRMASGAFQAEGVQVIKAPMPGKVVQVLVAVGDEVEEGQGVVVIEAMKMENELRATKAGVVKELPAQAGDLVEAQAPLALIE